MYQFLCMAVLAIGFAACAEDDKEKYVPVVLDGAQVYFPGTLPSTYELAEDANSFVVEVSRVETKTTATVNINVEETTGKFSIPTSVTFAEGEDVAELTIGYNPEELEYEEFISVNLSIADETSTTPYGLATYSFTAGIPAPWTGWTTFGTGTYTFNGYYSGGTHGGRLCEVRTYKLDENIKQFRFSGLADAYGFVVDYNASTGRCSVQPQYVMNHSSYGPIYVASTHIYLQSLGKEVTEDDFSPSTFDPATGLFMLNLAYYVDAGYFAYDAFEEFQLDGFEVADYSAAVEYAGVLTSPNGAASAVINVGLGEDVESALVAIAPTTDPSEVLNGMLDGSIESKEITESETLYFPVSKAGKYTAVAITVGEGELQEAVYTTFEVMLGGSPFDAISGAPIEAYVGEWYIPSWNSEKSDYLPATVKQDVLETEDGSFPVLKVNGLSLYTFYQDDTFYLEHDPETGLLYLIPHYMENCIYQGKEFETYVGAVDTAAGYIYTGNYFIGGFTEDGTLRFLNSPENEEICDAFAIYAEGLGLLSYFSGLEWIYNGDGNTAESKTSILSKKSNKIEGPKFTVKTSSKSLPMYSVKNIKPMK